MNNKKPCNKCGKETNGHLIHVADILKKDAPKVYICNMCVDNYLDDKQVDVIMEFSLGKKGTKWENFKFFEKAIIIDGTLKNLYAYSHRVANSWKTLRHTSRVWYNTQRQEEVDSILNRYFNNPTKISATPKQIQFIQSLIAEYGIPKEGIYKKYNVTSIKDLSKLDATKLLEELLNKEGM